MNQKSYTDNIALLGSSSLRNKLIFLGTAFWGGAIFAIYSDYNMATGTGNLSMLLFLAANVYFPAKKIRVYFNIRGTQEFFNTFLVYHIWFNTAAFGVACAHCYLTLWSNMWLMVALVLMGWLTFAGFLMWIKYPPGMLKKGLYLLHTQQIVFFAMIFAMLKGHYVF